MIKELIKKKNNYWLIFILTVILCFGYFLTNSSMGIDDEMLDWYGSLYSAVAIGRLGRMAQWVIGYEYIPFFYDFLAIILYSIGITISVDCFKRFINNFSDKQALIFACIAVSFPFSAFLFAFMIVTLHIGTAILSASIGSYLFSKFLFEEQKIKVLVFSFLCLIFSISLYETSVIYFLISILFIIFMRENRTWMQVLKSFAMTGASIIAYNILLELCKFIMHINFDRTKEFVRYDYSSFVNFINSLLNGIQTLFENYLRTINHDFASFVIALSVILFAIITVYKSIKRKCLITLFTGLIIILLPLGAFFITGNGGLYYRVYAPFGYLAALAFAYLFQLTENKKVLSKFLIIFSIFIVLNQAKEINRIFYFENVKFKDDLTMAKQIMHDIREKGLSDKPIVFVGKREKITMRYNYDVEAPEITVSVFNWDKYNSPESEFFVHRGYNFMHHHGLNIIPFEEYTKENVDLIISETPKLNVYPKNGYIKFVEEGKFVIVKLGKSVFDDN